MEQSKRTKTKKNNRGGLGEAIRGFRLMIAFFTRIPVGIPDYTETLFASGIKTLPFVGLLIGGFLYVVSLLRFLQLPDSVLALFLVAAYCIVTGGLHFDGVADTCDGIFSGTDRKRTLEIMKDSRTGTFGVIGLALMVLSYYVFFKEIGNVSPLSALCMPVVGKTGMIVAAYKAKTARPSGMGYGFITRVGWEEAAVALFVMTAVCSIARPAYLLGAVAALLFALAMREGFQKKLGGLTGDTLGFICEVTQVLFLAMIFIIQYASTMLAA